MHFSSLPPLSLYIHFPWCVKKCPYCDFNSHAIKNGFPEKEYIQALLNDADHHRNQIQEREIHSIFMGGGTPSLFSADSVAFLLLELKKRFYFSENIEITLEANPGASDQDRFLGYYQAGVNRISLGVQSFSDAHLKSLGRIHDPQAALLAIDAIKQAGFSNFNIDLMFGLPNQSIAQALFDLETAIAKAPTHLSWYQLTLEPNTEFYYKPPVLPQDDDIFEMQQAGLNLLEQAKFSRYEVSAYTKDENFCRHNLNYWTFGDYLGIGAGAHSKVMDLNQQMIKRWMKPKHPQAYLLNPSAIQEYRELTKKDIIFEFMLNALRLKKPIHEKLFHERCGLLFSDIQKILDKAIQNKWLILENQSFQLTEMGFSFLNNVTELFLP